MKWADLPGWGARTLIMGVINVTPDSFSGDGLARADGVDSAAAALAQARRFVADGADILDVGGESTRPGATPLDVEAELRRVLPAVRAIAAALDAPISIDTYKAAVAAATLEAGAVIVNDVWGLARDPDLAPLVAAAGAPVVVMHNRSRPAHATSAAGGRGGHYVDMAYDDVARDVRDDLADLIARAEAAGVAPDQIVADPGIGFGKTIVQNLELLNRLDELKALGKPILLGASRKSFIGYTLDAPMNERAAGDAAAVAIGIARGAAIVRVHDVRHMARVARMSDAIVRAGVGAR